MRIAVKIGAIMLTLINVALIIYGCDFLQAHQMLEWWHIAYLVIAAKTYPFAGFAILASTHRSENLDWWGIGHLFIMLIPVIGMFYCVLFITYILAVDTPGYKPRLA